MEPGGVHALLQAEVEEGGERGDEGRGRGDLGPATGPHYQLHLPVRPHQHTRAHRGQRSLARLLGDIFGHIIIIIIIIIILLIVLFLLTQETKS